MEKKPHFNYLASWMSFVVSDTSAFFPWMMLAEGFYWLILSHWVAHQISGPFYDIKHIFSMT